ncbi:MAG: UDP-N-acetylglucosamine 2-epimerase [Flavipsychrobacter sp.]|nr:UDP-N-acetylglucosamine 2-epimerase [Flavipsychrobacter sp.]
MKIATIIGARPQFVKAAVVSNAFKSSSEIKEIIIHTGQHYDQKMSDIFFDELQIPKPDYNLSIPGGNHGASTGQMMEKIEEVLMQEKPDVVLVYGDTNSTLAGALTAKKLHIKVIHIEAGLRSFEMQMPEEVNRILTDRISDILFCPTDLAIKNLKNEGFDNFKCTIIKSGDVMQDVAIRYSKISDESSDIIKRLGLTQYILGTIHRAENTDNIGNLTSIVAAFNLINKEIKVVIPIHPRTKKLLAENNITCDFDLIDPVGYLDMVQLIKNSSLVMTDSGGLQKEAFFFQKHCVTIREQTEWVELVDNGFNVIAGTKTDNIVAAYRQMISKQSNFEVNLYGGGQASGIIRDSILQHLS